MLKLRPNRYLLILISLTLLWESVMAVQAAPPQSVGLLSFEATALESAVRLDWETATELQTAGFIIKRSVNGGAFISLPDIGVPGFVDADGNPAGFVISEGGPAEGATYQEMDNDVQAGNSYTYKLVEVENDNSEGELATQTVVFGSVPTDTPTAQSPATNTPTPIVTATETSLPNSTASSTATTTATVTQTANNGPTNRTPTAVATVPGLLPPTLAPPTQPETVVEAGEDSLASTDVTAGNAVFAQAEATATAVPPSLVEPTANGDNNYPGLQAQTEPTQEPGTPTPMLLEVATAYPLGTRGVGEEPGTMAVPVIGGQNSDQSGGSVVDPSQVTSSRQQRLGKIYLWGGFLLSLLIFIMAVVATILLFTRKRTQ